MPSLAVVPLSVVSDASVPADTLHNFEVILFYTKVPRPCRPHLAERQQRRGGSGGRAALRGGRADKGSRWSRWRLARLVMKWSAAIVAPPGRPWSAARQTVVGGGDASGLSRRNGGFVATRQYLLQWFSGSPWRVSRRNLSLPAGGVPRGSRGAWGRVAKRGPKIISVILKPDKTHGKGTPRQRTLTHL